MRNLTTKDKVNILRELLIKQVGIIEATQLYKEAVKEFIKLKKLMYED